MQEETCCLSKVGGGLDPLQFRATPNARSRHIAGHADLRKALNVHLILALGLGCGWLKLVGLMRGRLAWALVCDGMDVGDSSVCVPCAVTVRFLPQRSGFVQLRRRLLPAGPEVLQAGNLWTVAV